VRVLGHEMNNPSLAPIKSLAASLELAHAPKTLSRQIGKMTQVPVCTLSRPRADSLSRFLQAYTRLTKLPPPQKQHVDLGELVQRVVDLEPRLNVKVRPGPKNSDSCRRSAD